MGREIPEAPESDIYLFIYKEEEGLGFTTKFAKLSLHNEISDNNAYKFVNSPNSQASLPPILFDAVARSWWPVALLRHSAEEW